MENSLSTPHVYELGNQLMAGLHTLTMRVDNQVKIKVGDWAHSVTDHTQGNWNGLVGRLEIEPGPLIWFQDLRVFPDAGGRSIRVEGRIGNQTGLAGTSKLEIAVSSLAADNKASIPSVVTTHSEPVAWSTRGGQFSLSIDLPVNADLWDEFNPVLHELSASLTGLGATHRVRFGLRDIGVKNRMFTVNGRPTFLRGTLECSIFPLTGYPPTDV
jgi:hypothetical protein